MSGPKIKEKPPVKEAIKEKVISAPKELVRRGTAASTSKLTGQIKEAAQLTVADEDQPETVSAEAPVTAAQRAGQLAARKIDTAKRAKLKEKPGAETAEVPPEVVRPTVVPAEKRNKVKGKRNSNEMPAGNNVSHHSAGRPSTSSSNAEQLQGVQKQAARKATGQSGVQSSNADKASSRKGPSNNIRVSRANTLSPTSATVKEIKRKDTAPKGPPKTAKVSAHTKNTGIKTVDRSAKNAASKPVPTQRTQHVQRRSAKARKRSAATKGAATAAEVAKKLTASVKNLGAALGAGDGVILAITLIIVLVAGVLCSPLGIFFSGETEGDLTLRQVMSQLNTEFSNKISEIENSIPHDNVQQTGQRALWKEVLTIYAVKTTTDTENSLDAATMDEAHAEVLREIFWDMNQIDYATEPYTEEVSVETPGEDSAAEGADATEFVEKTRLIITISGKTADEMATEYGFNQEQLGYVAELLSDEYADLWTMLSVGGGSDDIVAVAQSQLGNVGGQLYWNWYGFSNRVSWCACFVSWCADQCGYIETGTFPKFSYCDTGIAWFRTQGQWQDGSYIPSPGNIIFFDWDGNDVSDHVGIVESCDGATVYTIEGNANDAVKRLSYAVGDGRIMGYGLIEK